MLLKNAITNMSQIMLDIEGLMSGTVIEEISVTDNSGGDGTLTVTVVILNKDNKRFSDVYEYSGGVLTWKSMIPWAA